MWCGFHCSLDMLELADFQSLGALVAHLTAEELTQLKSNVSQTSCVISTNFTTIITLSSVHHCTPQVKQLVY